MIRYLTLTLTVIISAELMTIVMLLRLLSVLGIRLMLYV